MSISFVVTRPGAEALATLRDVLHAQRLDGPLSPATVLVPNNAAGVLARRGLAAAANGIAGVHFLTLYRLAELLGGPALADQARSPISAPLLTGFIRAGLQSDRYPRLSAVRDHPATVDALRRSYREIRELPDEVRGRLAGAGSPLAREVVSLHRYVETAMHTDWYDEADLYTSATSVLAHDPQRHATRLGPLVMFLPSALTEPAAEFVRHLAQATAVIVVGTLTGDTEADKPLGRIAERLGCPALPVMAPLSRHVDVLDASDADEEVRGALRRVVAAAANGTPYDRIAMLWTSSEPYARAVCEALDTAGIRWNGPDPSTINERIAPRTLLGLLDVARRGWTRNDLLAWLSQSPLLRNHRPIPVALWERLSRKAGVARGPDWQTRLLYFSSVCPDYERDHVEALRSFVADLRHDLPTDPNGETRPWASWARWAKFRLNGLLGNEQRRADWAPAERRAAESLDLLLDRLRALDAVEQPATLSQFHDTLADALSASFVRAGRIGDGVMVGGLAHAHGLTAELVVVLGASDDLIPPAVHADPLIGESDRALVQPLLPTVEQRRAEARNHLGTALLVAPQTVVTYARGDLRRSSARVLSHWVSELAGAESLHPIVIPSFVSGLIDTAMPTGAWEFRLRGLVAHTFAGGEVDQAPFTLEDLTFRRNLALVRARQSDRITVFDGDLSGCNVPSPFDGQRAVGATSLETYVSCPHAYFARHVLGVYPVENPEDVITLSALDQGTVVHEALDEFLRAVIDGQTETVDGEPWTEQHLTQLLATLDAHGDAMVQRGAAGRSSLWANTIGRLKANVADFIVRDASRVASGVTPVASEQAFGDEPDRRTGKAPAWPAATFTTSAGRTIRFHGSVDRVDQGTDGQFHVIDYKTGSRRKYSAIKQDNPTAGGANLQLAVYGTALAQARNVPLDQIRTEYVFIGRGADKADSNIGYVLDPTTMGLVHEAFDALDVTLADGLFPPRPEPPSFFERYNCRYCDPDGLGSGGRHRVWLRKRTDPRLAAYTRLTGEVDAS